jgi:hypothetical protein
MTARVFERNISQATSPKERTMLIRRLVSEINHMPDRKGFSKVDTCYMNDGDMTGMRARIGFGATRIMILKSDQVDPGTVKLV